MVCLGGFFVYVYDDRNYQQGQGASAFVSACHISGGGPGGRDTGHETGLERRTRAEADL